MKPRGINCFLIIDIGTVGVTNSKIEVVSGVDKITQGEIVVDDGSTQALAYVVVVFVGTVVGMGFKDIFTIIETVFVFTIQGILKFVTEIDSFVMVLDEADAFIKIGSHGMGECLVVVAIVGDDVAVCVYVRPRPVEFGLQV